MNRLAQVIVAVAFALALTAAAAKLGLIGDEPKAKAVVAVDYQGMWKSEGDLKFAAKIYNDTITITWVVDAKTSGLYWVGTFPHIGADGQIVTSIGNTEEMKSSVYGSTDTTKVFKLGKDEISFVFQALGTTHVIVLTK